MSLSDCVNFAYILQPSCNGENEECKHCFGARILNVCSCYFENLVTWVSVNNVF